MPITDGPTGTRIDEIATRIFRISVPVPANPVLPQGFSFNQFLVAAEEPLLFHTGPRKLFSLVRDAVATVLRPETLRYVAFSHVEGDESGALLEWLALAPHAMPLCSRVAAMTFASDASDRPVRAMADGERLDLGHHQLLWFDAPHVPHGWDCGYLAETNTRTLLCSDLFTQAGSANPPVTERDILEPSEVMRRSMDYFAHSRDTRHHLERLAAFDPVVLACMHGSAFAGNGRAQLIGLADALA